MIITETMKKSITQVAQSHGLALVVLFGSQARGDAHKASDIDIAYSSLKTMNLSDENRMANDFFNVFRTTKLEFVNMSNANPFLLKKIMDDAVVLYEKKPSLFSSLYLYVMNIYRESQFLQQLHQEYVLNKINKFKKDVAYAG